MPNPWNASTERKLLLRLIDPKATPKWHVIAQGMGPHFSAEACRYVPPASFDMPLAIFAFCFPSIFLLHSSHPRRPAQVFRV